MGGYQYGVELYSVKNELAKDMPGTLKKVSRMGYTGVEFAGGFPDTAAAVKKAMEEAGLVCCGWHTPWAYVQDDMFDKTVEYFKAVGNRYVIIPGLPGGMLAAADAAKQTAGIFNKIADKLATHGMRLGYHNHAAELQFFPGTSICPFTVFFDNTDPSIIIQMDNGHVLNGRGMGMLSLLRRYPNRFTTVHLKPYSYELGAIEANKGYETMIGQDDVPWMDFMHICGTTGGTEWFIVEYEGVEAYPELVGVDECLKALKAMEKRGEI